MPELKTPTSSAPEKTREKAPRTGATRPATSGKEAKVGTRRWTPEAEKDLLLLLLVEKGKPTSASWSTTLERFAKLGYEFSIEGIRQHAQNHLLKPFVERMEEAGIATVDDGPSAAATPIGTPKRKRGADTKDAASVTPAADSKGLPDEAPVKRRRGRPTKAAKAAELAAQAAVGKGEAKEASKTKTASSEKEGTKKDGVTPSANAAVAPAQG